MVSCSIILPSRDGADTLPLVLEALAKIDRAGNEVEIILVDNCSTDGTTQLMGQFAAEHGAIVLSEERPGKSHALNSGIDRATGELLLFLDDDAIPDARWLRAYVDAAAEHSNLGTFAGAIRAHWLQSPPDWLAELARLGRACGCTPPDRMDGPIKPEDLKGANFAVRREVLGELRFDTGVVNFGQGRTAIGGEDTMMAGALAEKGGAIRFVKDAAIAHVILPKEMGLSFQLARFARIGRGMALARDRAPLWYVMAKSAGYSVKAGLRFLTTGSAGAGLPLSGAAMNYGEASYRLGRIFKR